MQGFDPSKVPSSYGDTLTFWDWQKRTITQQIKLGAEGLIPLETRFLHEPSQAQGYVGAALSSNVIRFSKVGHSLRVTYQPPVRMFYKTQPCHHVPRVLQIFFYAYPVLNHIRLAGTSSPTEKFSHGNVN